LVDIGGTPGNEKEAVASLKTALIGFETAGASITSIVNCPQTCTRRIITPHMPKKELTQAIQWEAKNAIPFSIDDALMGFDVLGEVAEKGVKKMIVAVAAAPKGTVNRLLALFSKAGIEIATMIPASLSLQNLITASGQYQELNTAVVEIGAAITELNIYQKGRLAFSRKLPIAGRDITKAMTSTLMSAQGKIELTLEEAEKIKKEIGIPAVEDDKTIDGKILPSQVLSLVRPCVEQLASEIERSFDFFREESHGGKVDKVILFGGGANLKGLTKSLYNALEIEAVIGDSLEDIKTLTANDKSGDQAGSQFDLAIGAVLNRSDKINLLPVEVKEKTRRFVEKVSFKAVVAGIAMTLLLTYIGLNIQVASQNKELNALKLEQRTLAPQLEALRSVIISGRIFKNHPYWEDVLREISNTVQPKMFLTDLSMKNDRINIKGIIMQGDQGGQAVLSNFMITLEEGMFRDVNLVMTKRGPEGEPDLNFEIEADID
jgi:type IV pilus assembly protein PilM